MAKLREEYNNFLKDIEENLKNKEDLEYIKVRFSMFVDKVIDEMDMLVDYKTQKMNEIEQKQKEIDDKMSKMQQIIDNIEKNYKAMYTAEENYREVKRKYLTGETPVAQLIDAQQIYLESKLSAVNSQNKFFQQLVWVQRAICAVNWSTADEDSKKFIQSVKDKI